MNAVSPSIYRPARIRFDRNELSGAFGDIGTDFPLVVGMILVAGFDPASVLIVFGSLQILTGNLYGMPMPVQPLKAVAALVITQKLGGDIHYCRIDITCYRPRGRWKTGLGWLKQVHVAHPTLDLLLNRKERFCCRSAAGAAKIDGHHTL
jgi:hypothetical protein